MESGEFEARTVERGRRSPGRFKLDTPEGDSGSLTPHSPDISPSWVSAAGFLLVVDNSEWSEGAGDPDVTEGDLPRSKLENQFRCLLVNSLMLGTECFPLLAAAELLEPGVPTLEAEESDSLPMAFWNEILLALTKLFSLFSEFPLTVVEVVPVEVELFEVLMLLLAVEEEAFEEDKELPLR